jgi:hypothetical protein
MTIKEIYAISNEGNIHHYAHFFFAVLMPLLYYDIKTKHSHSFIIKINIGTMSKILIDFFKERVFFDYIENPLNTVSDKFNYFDTFIRIKKLDDPNIILLDAFDIYNDSNYKFITSKFNNSLFEKLDVQYNNYYSKKIDNQPVSEKETTQLKKNKLIYKQLYFTNLYYKIILCQPSIQRYLRNTYKNNHYTNKILLIERPFTPPSNNLLENSSGQRRLIYNHLELKTALTNIYKDEFINCILDTLPFEEQYYLFKNVKIIIGQHGAGLVNIFLSKPTNKTHLIEITPEWNNNWFKNLANLCEINYYNVSQPKMTQQEFDTFTNKYHLNKTTDEDIINSFKKNSGSVNINEILEIIKTIL